MASNVVRTSPLQKVHKRYGERLGTKLSKKLNVEKLRYNVSVFSVVPTEVVGHILGIADGHVHIHNIRKSGSQKMDVSYIPLTDVIAIEGKKGELGQLRVKREKLVIEYKGVQLKNNNGMFVLTDGNGDTYVINSTVDDVRIEIVADPEAAAPAKKASKKDAKKVSKKPKKTGKKKVADDEDDF